MIGNKTIKDFFGDRLKQRRMNKIRNRFNMRTIWKKIFILFIVINVIVVIISSYLFFKINYGEIFLVDSNTNVSIETVNRTLLLDTINFFEIKEKEFDNLKTNKVNLVDPSL